jgi:hypothetical protein
MDLAREVLSVLGRCRLHHQEMKEDRPLPSLDDNIMMIIRCTNLFLNDQDPIRFCSLYP